MLVKAVGSGYANQLAKCRITVLISKFCVELFEEKTYVSPKYNKIFVTQKTNGWEVDVQRIWSMKS